MADSPAPRHPIDPKEQPILDELLKIRDDLLLLKSDKSQYVKSQDVLKHYDKVLVQTGKLNEIRITKRDEQNRLDTVLDDCFQLISLFFLTIGRNNEAPAAYSMTSTIKRLLDHLRQAGFYTHKDVLGIKANLDKVRESIERGRSHHDAQMITLLEARIDSCNAIVAELQEPLSRLSPELEPTHEKLVSILRSLSGLNLKAKFPVAEVKEFQNQLREMESKLEGHPVALPPSDKTVEERYIEKVRHISYDANATMDGKDVVVELLARCLLWSEILLQRQGKIDERFRDIFDNLLAIKNQLDKLSMTQAWSLRETDLYGYQRKLDRYDEARVNDNFVDALGRPAELYEQRTLLYLMRKSYVSIYMMITSSEPVSEALQPIYNQLMTLRKCLIEVKRSGGVSSPRELYPYSMKLNSIDNMREDGKFVVNGDIPEGQGSVTGLMAECFELAYELRTDAEEHEAEEDDDEDDDSTPHNDTAGAIPRNAAVVPAENGTSVGIGVN